MCVRGPRSTEKDQIRDIDGLIARETQRERETDRQIDRQTEMAGDRS